MVGTPTSPVGRFPVPPEARVMSRSRCSPPWRRLTTRAPLDRHPDRAPAPGPPCWPRPLRPSTCSRGVRVDLGVGTGWQREEYEAPGLDFGGGVSFSPTCGGLPASVGGHAGRVRICHSRLRRDLLRAQPAQARLPVWFVRHAARPERPADRRAGDGWIPIMGASLEDVRGARTACGRPSRRPGRGPASLHVQVPAVVVRGEDRVADLEATMRSVPPVGGRGATDIAVNLRVFCPIRSTAPPRSGAIADASPAWPV